MKPKQTKKLLSSSITNVANTPADYSMNPESDFTRNRKLSFKQMLTTIIGMGNGTLTSELLQQSHYSTETVSSSAFVQQRNKIKPEAFETIFKSFSRGLVSKMHNSTLPILAVDGTDLHTPTNSKEKDSFIENDKERKPFNQLHLNALYDLKQGIYVDACIQGWKSRNEHKALIDMVDRSTIPQALVIADRGYESYNNMAHIQEKGWKFLIRIKDGACGIKSSFCLPKTDTFDVNIRLKITRKQTKEIKELLKDKNRYKFIAASTLLDYLPSHTKQKAPAQFYELNFRIGRLQINETTYETIVTNLDEDEYPLDRLKQLYVSRWGIETSFRALKYTTGLLYFHSKKVTSIYQEIYAHLIMYNFTQAITTHVVIQKKQRKYAYQANFSIATHICKKFYNGKITSPNAETIIAKNIVPLRPERKYKRDLHHKATQRFYYRVA